MDPPAPLNLPSPPDSGSPTNSLFSFHRAPKARPISHYRTFSSTIVYPTPPTSPAASQLSLVKSNKFSHSRSSSIASSLLAVMGQEDPKQRKQPGFLSTKLKKSTRQLKQLFIDPALQDALPTAPSASTMNSMDHEEDYGVPLIVPHPRNNDYYTRPLIERSASSLHPYGSDATYLQSYSHLERCAVHITPFPDINLISPCSELYSHMLLQRINPHGGPAFHDYPVAPKEVLDLGSGASHWAAFAARSWKDSNVTAFDMVDVRQPSLPMPSNVKFVLGN